MKKLTTALLIPVFLFTFTITPFASAKARAHAICKDGTYSYSEHRQGTCSHHGGVKKWLY